MGTIQIISIILSILCFLVIWIIGTRTDLLREPKGAASRGVTEQPKPSDPKTEELQTPYSFSRVQLWLWTLVIIPAFVLYWGFITGHQPDINKTALILLGISVGSLTSANIIQSGKTNNKNKVDLKNERLSETFWRDILTDDKGQFSIGRLQHFLFTMVYLVIYVVMFFDACMVSYPVFDDKAFILMGITAGGYLLGKGMSK